MMLPKTLHILKIIFLISLAAAVDAAPSAAREMEPYPIVKLRSLDKITARTETFEAAVGSTVKFGPLYIKIQSCQKASPLEQPESAAFLQVWEMPVEKKAQWIFSGWMFASSPALSHMDHPIYDVWVLDCLAEKGQDETVTPPARAGEGEVKEGEAPATPDEIIEGLGE
ncbi:MAG: DUF2155 domain-containing protein [Alphaproteobacteria bacterium]